MNGQMDKSLFFITLSAVCIWLIVDMAVGKDHLGNFLSTLFPFMDSSGSSGSIELTKEQEENMPKGGTTVDKEENMPKGGTTVDKEGFSGSGGSIELTKEQEENMPKRKADNAAGSNNEKPYGAKRPKGGRPIE